MKSISLSTVRNQQGAALLAFVLVMLVGSSFLLVSKLNAKVRDRENVERTYDALQRAKEALIGYAVSYPEITAAPPTTGPGYLPCPDRNPPDTANSGTSGVGGPPGGACSIAGGTSVGRLPFLTIGMPEAVDSNGEVLWYAVSDDFRNNPPVAIQNSDSPFFNPLSLDGPINNNIVAVVISPGVALDTPLNNPGGRQNREVNNVIPRNYLEGVNWDNNPDFESNNPLANRSNFNDRVVAITRQDLMSAVERRVLGDVAKGLENYRISGFSIAPSSLVVTPNTFAYPWLSPFSNPSQSRFNSNVDVPPGYAPIVPNLNAGHLPVHWNGVVGPAPGPNDSFSASLNEVNYSWDVDPGTAVIVDTTPGTSHNTIVDSCLESSTCIGGGINFTPPAGMTCTWTNRASVNCVPPPTFSAPTIGPYACTVNGCNDQCTLDISLTINNNLSNYVGNITAIIPPTAGVRRLREVNVNAIPDNPNFLEVTETMVNNDPNAGCVATGPVIVNRKQMNFNASTGSFRTSLPYELDTSGTAVDVDADGFYLTAGDILPELPPWFITNNWHELVYVAYAPEPLPGVINPTAGGVCDNGVIPCINLTSTQGAQVGQTNNQIRAIVLMAGQDLTPAASPRPNGIFNDYFEGLNANAPPNNNFDQQLTTNVFNDQVRFVNTNNNP